MKPETRTQESSEPSEPPHALGGREARPSQVKVAGAILCRTRQVPMQDPQAILTGLAGGPRYAWLAPEATWVAEGVAARLEAEGPGRLEVIRGEARGVWQSVRQARERGVPDRVGPVLLGGFAFHDDARPHPPWQSFPGALFILPERLWTWHAGALYETTAVPARTVTGGSGARPATPTRRGEPPGGVGMGTDRKEWTQSVRRVLEHIRAGDVTKVVLARAKGLPPVDPAALIAALPPETGTSRFLFEPVPGHALVGASPEPLIRIDGVTAHTVALAGTAARGRDPREDKVRAQDLVESPKDNLEHGLTVTWLEERLHQAGALRIDHGKRRLRRLGHVQHLETPIQAQVPAGMHVLDAARELHPTPAVGGVPPREGLEIIARLERTPRGWYAGGVGWFGPSGEGTLVTAIRCSLATKEALWAYAGAGIVAGSDPDAEWEETRWKMRLVEKAARSVREGT